MVCSQYLDIYNGTVSVHLRGERMLSVWVLATAMQQAVDAALRASQTKLSDVLPGRATRRQPFGEEIVDSVAIIMRHVRAFATDGVSSSHWIAMVMEDAVFKLNVDLELVVLSAM